MDTHPYVKELHDRRARALDDARRLLDRADAERRDLTASEDAAWRRLHDTITNVDDQLRRWEGDKRAAATADDLRRDITRATYIGSTYADGGTLRAGFAEARDGRASAFDSDLSPEFRALASAGGSAIATSFYEAVTVYERNHSPIMRLATVLANTSGAPIVLPRLTADTNVAGTATAEEAGITEADPTISSVTLGALKYAAITLWSAELDQDNVVNLEDLVARSSARQLAESGFYNHFTNGTGTVQPWGFVARASVAGTAAGTAVTGGANYVGWTDVADLYGSVASGYADNGTFLCSPTAYTAALKWRDTTGQPILQTGFEDGTARLFGRPVVRDPNMAALGSATKSWAFGDFSRYFITRVTPARIEISRDYKFSTDQIAIKVVERVDGDLVDTAAVKVLVSANT